MAEFSYEGFIAECYKKKLDKKIHNASEENALLLFKTLLDKAIRDKENVRIVSGKLLARFYNQLTDKIATITGNGNTISVIVENDIDDKENNNFYQKLKDSTLLGSKKFSQLPNFIVVGNNSFRYETDKKSTKAIANFNNESMGGFLAGMFDKLSKDIVGNTKSVYING